MRRAKHLTLLLVWLLAGPVAAGPAQAPKPRAARPAADAPETAVEPVPFSFYIEELSLSSRGRVILEDSFDSAGRFQPAEVGGKPAGAARYFLSLGRLGGPNVKGGALRVDQSDTINAYGTFVSKFVLPVDERGRLAFSGEELFGDLLLSVRVRAPALRGHERLKIGIGDMATMGALASISLQKDSISLQRQGRAAWDEVLLDRVDISRMANLQEVELTLKIDARGQFSGLTKIRGGGKEQEFALRADDPWARISPDNPNLSANVFVEALPKPRIFALYPQSLPLEKLRQLKGAVPLRIVGTGFAPDTEVEVVPPGGGPAAPIQASEVKLLTANTYLSAKVTLPEAGAGDYSVRVTTGEQSTLRRNIIHVY
ncbi:MAG: hypothetical protein JOZ02_00560 [Acidobacteria bacterium]|nr:hypothetical protein [Acidobacteriota bacterium]